MCRSGLVLSAHLISSRFVQNQRGLAMYFLTFSTQSVGVNVNLGV